MKNGKSTITDPEQYWGRKIHLIAGKSHRDNQQRKLYIVML